MVSIPARLGGVQPASSRGAVQAVIESRERFPLLLCVLQVAGQLAQPMNAAGCHRFVDGIGVSLDVGQEAVDIDIVEQRSAESEAAR